MSIALINTQRRMLVFLLPHAMACMDGDCACTKRRDGKLLPPALTLPARARVPDLRDAILAVPEIAAAIRVGALRVERTETEGGPRGAPTPVEVADERRAPFV